PPAPPRSHTLSLHDALPICLRRLLEDPSCECSEFFTGANADERRCYEARVIRAQGNGASHRVISIQDVTARQESERQLLHQARLDRKSTRLNSSHDQISYAV